jgi:hypothetical protein
VEHERQAFGRRQAVEDDEQRQADRIRQQRQALGVGGGGFGAALDARHDRVGQLDTDELLPTSRAGAQPVETEAGDDRRQPAAEVLDVVRTCPTRPEPGVLDGVVGLGERPEHPVRDGSQVRAMVLETSGEPIGVSHRSRSGLRVRHQIDDRNHPKRDRGPP